MTERGAHFRNQLAQGRWSQLEPSRSSNWWEFISLGWALLSFSDLLNGHHIKVVSDNAATVAYLNKQRGTRSAGISDLLVGRAQSSLDFQQFT